MTPLRPRARLTLALLLLPVLALAAWALQARLARTAAPRTPDMATLLPPGALLTIQSPDFQAVLNAWTTSPEQKTWLSSANYSVFANSRLFGRLAAAQNEFASTARLQSAGTTLLQQVAGGQSIFAWYDIGELQFLYITRMPAGRTTQSELFTHRASFSRRQAGSSVFYVRSELVPGTTRRRTVAFATSGDLLLLSTREDLMAQALTLISAPGPPTASQAAEPWYAEASAAAPAGPTPPMLHMVLNLERIVPSPYFRSYWVQQNVTEMSGYRSAVADLYREASSAGTRFREERTLLPKLDAQATPDSAVQQPADSDLGSLAALPAPGTGVFRATATSDSASAVAAVEEKLLGRETLPTVASTQAPDPGLTPTLVGDPSDLDTRIDTPAPVSAAASTDQLTAMLDAAGLNATLTLDSATASPTLWLPIHSAVVLRTARPLDPAALAAALQAALRGTLTASSLGIELRPTPADPRIFALSGPKPLFVAIAGPLCLLSNDVPTLTTLLTRLPAAAQAPPVPATLIAAFDHTSQRQPYARLTTLIDAPDSAAADTPAAPGTPTAPAFFSGNIRSLSDTFAPLASEQVLIRHEKNLVRQTVLYNWQP